MPRLSIVIPVYNAEQYLDECLNSLAAQQCGDFEIICIDDGSTDGSRALIETRAHEDARIRLLSKENGGPSSARNAGIRASRGDYVMFLDADDMLAPNACLRIVEALAEQPADALVYGWSCFGGEPSRWMLSNGTVNDRFYPLFAPALLFDEHTQPFLRVAAKRSLLAEHDLAFDETLRIGEDAAFLFALFPRATGVRLVSDKLYRYRLARDGSLMRSIAGDDVAECVNCLDTAISIFDDWRRAGLLDQYGSDLVEWSIRYALYTMLRQEPPVRDLLASTLAELWLAHWTRGELDMLPISSHAKRLMGHALHVGAPGLSRDLALYRVAEYGIEDLFATAAEKISARR